MSKNDMVMVKRELLERLDFGKNTEIALGALPELRATLAQPAQQHQGEPVAPIVIEVKDACVYLRSGPLAPGQYHLYTHADPAEASKLRNEAHRFHLEVERLRADRDSFRETFDNLIDKLGIVRSEAQKEPGKPSDVFAKHVDKLRAQLAEAQALLNEWCKMFAGGHPNGAQVELRRRTEAHLSASAEPSAPKCETCSDHGAVGNILNAEPCPDCSYSAPVERDERAEFENWYLAEYYEGDAQCGLEWLSTEPCGGYRYSEPGRHWKVWQARAALERKP